MMRVSAILFVSTLWSLVTQTKSLPSTQHLHWNEVKDPCWDEPQARVFEVESDSDINDLNSDLQPGNVMVMKSGEWSDARITITASGQDERGYRIYLVPEVYGEVKMTGKVQITFVGSNIEVRGVWIDGISDDKITPVLFEEGSSKCRFTDSAITNFNREVHDKKHHWTEAWGSYHTIDWNSFEEKVGTGQLVRVKSPNGDQLPPGTDPPSWGATISHNYFGNIQVRYNTFEESACTVTLRHGDCNRVGQNYFLCKGKDSCGGIRVYGNHHEVTNNYIEEENGRSGQSAGIVLQAAPSDYPLNRPAKDCLIDKNRMVDCHTCIYAGSYGSAGGEAPPENIYYRGNIMTAASTSNYILRKTDQGQNSVYWEDNIGYGGRIDNEEEYEYGLKQTDPEIYWDSDWGIYRPGASGLDFCMSHRPLTHKDVGPTWKSLSP